MSDYQSFFTLIGQLNTETEEGLSYFPLFLKEQEIDFKEIMETESDMHAFLLNEEGEPILQVPLSYGYYCTDPGRLPQLAVRGYIPYDERTRTIRFKYKDNVIDQLQVPEEKPHIEVTTELPERVDSETIDLEWESSYEGDAPLQYKVLYSNDGGETWQRVGNRTDKQVMEIDVGELPGGENCQFSVQVTDGYNNASSQIGGFSIEYKPYDVMILSPLDGAVLSSDRSILLNGQAHDPNTGEEIVEEMYWTSSIEGELGEGSLVQTRLCEGEHEIKLQVGKSESSVNIQVK